MSARIDISERIEDMNESVEQHSVARSIALHLLPAIPVMAFYVLMAPVAMRIGLPPGIALIIGFAVIGIPIELGYLLCLGRKRNGRISLDGIVLFRRSMRIWQYIIFFLLLLTFAFTVLFLISPVTGYLAVNLFSWMPSFLLPDGSDSYPPFVPTAVIVTLILGLIFDGIINPIVEELYFRGYLFPRITRFGWWTPAISAFLFSLQHYWQPYNWPLIFIIQLAIVYVVYWKRNIYISMLAHCGGNTIGAILSLIGFLTSS